MNGNQQILAATYTVDGDSFKANRAELVSDVRIGIRPRQRSFNVHPDGNRFVVATAPETAIGAKQDRLVFIFNFFDELRRLAPVSKR
jgi:hypothetical protein